MRCDDLYDRHVTPATPCHALRSPTKIKTNLRLHDPKNIGRKKTSQNKSAGNFSHNDKISEISLYVLRVISKIDNNVDMFREL